jgi:radical SAM/Cys-rich protein
MKDASFNDVCVSAGTALRRSAPKVLQLNVGKLCNLTCEHCHVNAGPRRKEIITRETIDRILAWMRVSPVRTLDLTGGTPEMVPDFRYLIETVRSWGAGHRIIDRLNATILSEPGYEWVAPFLAAHAIEVVASMPCYEPKNVNEQRGDGVFDRSIAAFQELNRWGYGRDPRLVLNFVYNPNGAFLPGDQAGLRADYQEAMSRNFGIVFNDLYTITNMPISRFKAWLKREGKLADYMDLLRQSFNPATVDGLMCRETLNVSWLGEVFDCDFNQMLALPIRHPETGQALYLWEVSPELGLGALPIATGAHCFACTAGCGSSCGGALAA